MHDVVILLGAIVLLLAMQLLRTVLAFVFPSAVMPRVESLDVPESIADLHAAAAEELHALGFTGPAWYVLRYTHEDKSIELPAAAWTHAGGNACWLYPIAGPDKPNRLNTFYATRLADGRTAVSQAFDPYCQMVATPMRPSRTIGGETFAAQVADHDAWVASLGAAPDPAGTSPEALDAFNADFFDGSRQHLLDEHKAWVDSRGLARPTLRFALRVLRLVLKRPKPAPNMRPIPPARLAALSLTMQRIVERPAPRRMQALLFAVSVVLFLVLGAAFWSWSFAVVLLVVIAIHEFGHYLAMLAFGYRNVQMLALPLVGGVTIGHEAKPDAARRAWMSLAGPLPGIVIGWCMALALWFVDGLPPWWVPAMLAFLALNYLNVLPVPPLDGGHVVQALLPVRAARAQAVFIAVLCVFGAATAQYFDQPALAVIALLQLLTVAPLWRLARLIERARHDAGVAPDLAREARLTRVFELADATFGPVVSAGPRMAHAQQTLRALDAAPMRPLQRATITLVYLALLAVPVAGAAWWWQSQATAHGPSSSEAQEASRQRNRAQAEQVAGLDLATLLRDATAASDTGSPLPAPATQSDIDAAQQRLGLTLPDDIVALYRIADGVPALQIVPIASLARLDARPDFSLTGFVEEDRVTVWPWNGDDIGEMKFVDIADVHRWLVLTPKQSGQPLAYDASPTPSTGLRAFAADEPDFLAYPTLRRWLEIVREGQLATRTQIERVEAAIAAARQPLEGLAMPALLDKLPRPSFQERLLQRRSPWTVGPPASPADVEAAERRLGVALPADLRELYARHDGITAMRVLPAASLRRVDITNGVVRQYLTAIVTMPPLAHFRTDPDFPATVEAFDGCHLVGGAPEGGITSANLVWCPRRDNAHPFVEVQLRRTYASLTDYVRDALARIEAGRTMR